MADWSTIASLATAGGTLVLAAATFTSVRSANRAARVAEQSLLTRLRPLLTSSRLEDPPEKIGFMDGHWVKVPGGCGSAEVVGDDIYLTMSLRNVGTGIAVLDRWNVHFEGADRPLDHGDPHDFRRLTRDLFIAPNDRGYWQGAIRDRADPQYDQLREIVASRQTFRIELLYSDGEGGQRMISLFAVIPRPSGDWLVTAARHWNLDRADPR
jgi:hypothetical protein